MSDPHGGGGGPKLTPGVLFGFLLAVAVGGFLILSLWGQGIMQFGQAEEQYSQVVVGAIALFFAIAAIASHFMDKRGGGGDKH